MKSAKKETATSISKLSAEISFRPRSIEDRRVLEVKPLIKPFAYAVLRQLPTGEKIYLVLEPPLSKDEKKVVEKIEKLLIESIDMDFEVFVDKAELKSFVEKRVRELLRLLGVKVSEKEFQKILYYVYRDFAGLEKIEPLMHDPDIEDISCDGYGKDRPVFIYHKLYQNIPTNIYFETEEELNRFLIKLAQKCGKHISVAEPILDGRLPDGSRVQATYGREVTRHGGTFTIRKFTVNPLTPIDLIKYGTFDTKSMAFLWYAMENKVSVLVCGSTAVGKTTTLNCLLMFAHPDAKIVTIEETPEIRIPHKNWISSVTRSGYGAYIGDRRIGEIDMFDLLKAALRQRPDFLVIGEIRGREAYTLFQAMASGHMGMSTLHADSVEDVIHRLEGKPINVPRVMLKLLNLIIFQSNIVLPSGKIGRRVKVIQEVVDVDPITRELLVNKVFYRDPIADRLIFTGRSYYLEKIEEEKGIPLEKSLEEIENRRLVLEWLVKNDIRDYESVTSVIRRYYADKDGILAKIRSRLYESTDSSSSR